MKLFSLQIVQCHRTDFQGLDWSLVKKETGFLKPCHNLNRSMQGWQGQFICQILLTRLLIFSFILAKAITVGAYHCTCRVVKHPKSKSTIDFKRPYVSPCMYYLFIMGIRWSAFLSSSGLRPASSSGGGVADRTDADTFILHERKWPTTLSWVNGNQTMAYNGLWVVDWRTLLHMIIRNIQDVQVARFH